MRRILAGAGIFVFLLILFYVNVLVGLQVVPKPKRALPPPGVTCTLEIISVSPRQVFASDQVTVGYYLTCSTTTSVSVIPIKVGLFFNATLAKTEDISNMPNGQRLRLFISGNAPGTAGRYTLMIKVVRADADPATATGSAVLAAKSQTVEVYQALPDLIIESFQVSDPELRDEAGRTYAYFPFSLRVKNSGGAEADRFAIGIFEGDIGYQVVEGRMTQSPLRRGQSVQISGMARTTIFPTSSQEVFRLRAKADVPTQEFVGPSGHIQELNEDNNLSAIEEVRFSFLRISGSYSGYRGSHIEISGSFGSSFSGKKVAVDRSGGFVGFAELISSSPNKLVIKIPKTNSFQTGQDHRLFIAEEGYPVRGRRLSNFVNLHIFNPLTITQVTSQCPVTFSPTGGMPPNILVKGYEFILDLSGDILTDVRFGFTTSLPARADSYNSGRFLRGWRHSASLLDALSSGRCYIAVADFRSPEYRTAESEGIAYQEVTVRANRNDGTSRQNIPLNINGGIIPMRVTVHIDHNGSWMDLTIMSTEMDRINFPRELARFEAKFAGRNILHKLQDINGWLGYERRRNVYDVRDSRIMLPVTFEAGPPIEIKRYAKGALGDWNDDLAVDINLRSLSFELSFGVGFPDQALHLGNIIHDVNVSVSLDADLSNIADGLEIWNIVDDKLKRFLKSSLQSIFAGNVVKQMFLNGVMNQVMARVQNAVIVNAYISGDRLIIDYFPLS